jgi:Raf kinase inhibitor-like YbhB/YbcL family protein
MALTLKSSAFGQEQRIPDRYTCEGDDISPPLSWSGAPPRTQSFALVCSDPDAPMKTWYHWAIFDIPATADHLDEGVGSRVRAGGLRQAVNDFGRPGYGGPCPPKGHSEHHYRFHLLALDARVAGEGALPRRRTDGGAARSRRGGTHRHLLPLIQRCGTSFPGALGVAMAEPCAALRLRTYHRADKPG